MRQRNKYSQEVRERAVRMVFDHLPEYDFQWSAILSISYKFGWTAETLRRWVRREEVEKGQRGGLTSVE